MGLDHLEFTVDDILNAHRTWVAAFVVKERKSEIEIAQLLLQQNLVVTVDDVKRCLEEWHLLPPPTFPLIPALEEFLAGESYELAAREEEKYQLSKLAQDSSFPSKSFSTPPTQVYMMSASIFSLNNAYVPPPDYEKYRNKPLPPIPPIPDIEEDPPRLNELPIQQHVPPEAPSTPTPPPTAAPSAPSPPTPPTRCEHGFVPSECSKGVMITLLPMPTGPTPLERYAQTVELHERIAVNLTQHLPEFVEVTPEVLPEKLEVGAGSDLNSSVDEDEEELDEPWVVEGLDVRAKAVPVRANAADEDGLDNPWVVQGLDVMANPVAMDEDENGQDKPLFMKALYVRAAAKLGVPRQETENRRKRRRKNNTES